MRFFVCHGLIAVNVRLLYFLTSRDSVTEFYQESKVLSRKSSSSVSAQQMVYGINAVGDLLRYRGSAVKRLLLDGSRKDARLTAIREQAVSIGIVIESLDRASLDKVVLEQVAPEKVAFDQQSSNPPENKAAIKHQGVIAYCNASEVRDEQFLTALVKSQDDVLLLILDGVTDPHNLGACMRSANAAGVHAVIVPKDNAVGLTPVVRKVASGACEITPLVVVKNLARCMAALQQQGVWLYGAAGETEQSLYDLDLKGSVALIMGAEGGGMRRLTRERCDAVYAIPMAGTVESLNVSVAAGVSLFEALRQRKK